MNSLSFKTTPGKFIRKFLDPPLRPAKYKHFFALFLKQKVMKLINLPIFIINLNNGLLDIFSRFAGFYRNGYRILHESLKNFPYTTINRCRKEKGLPIRRQKRHKIFDISDKPDIDHMISFI